MAIPKKRKRYFGIDDLRSKGIKNFHLDPEDFPGLSFNKATLGKIRLDQNDGTDIPLAQIPDILTGKDADTVDGLHLPNTIANLLTDHNKTIHDALGIDADLVDGYHLNQSVLKNSTPEFQNIKLKTLTGSGQLLYSKSGGELLQTSCLYWDTANQYLDINVNKTGYDNKLMKLRNTAGSVFDPGSVILQLESGDVSASFRVYHGGNVGNIQMWLSSDMTEGELGFSAGGTVGIEIQPSPTEGAGQVCFGGWQSPGGMYCFNTKSYWETYGYEFVIRESDEGIPFFVKKLGTMIRGPLGVGIATPAAKLHLVGGDIATEFNNAAIALGYSTTGAYPHFLHTRHNSANYLNSIDFYVSDGTEVGVFPTNAVHIMTLQTANPGLGRVGIGTTEPTAMLDINSNILRLRTSKTPASAGASGNAGDVCWDSSYIYVCVATNTWKRAAIATW